MSYLPLLKPITGTWLTHCLHWFFTSPGSIWKSEGYECCFKTSATIASWFSVRNLMNRPTKRFGFSSTKYTGSLPNVSYYVMLCILYLNLMHKIVYNKKLININWLMLHSLQETKCDPSLPLLLLHPTQTKFKQQQPQQQQKTT